MCLGAAQGVRINVRKFPAAYWVCSAGDKRICILGWFVPRSHSKRDVHHSYRLNIWTSETQQISPQAHKDILNLAVVT